MRKGRCRKGGGAVRGRRISRRAKRELRACWDVCIIIFDLISGEFFTELARGSRRTLVHALNVTGNHGPEYRMAQKTTVTRMGKVMMVV